MPDSPYVKKLRPGESANYRIEVQGTLDMGWSGRLGGMRIETSSKGDQDKATILSGTVRDQAELIGVLNSLYDLHLPLLSVEIVNE